MLARQTAIYFAANVISAIFGFLNVFAFTRIFAVEAFGEYVLGFGFATLYTTIVSTPLKFTILRDQSRNDGTDVRATALAAMALSLTTAPVAYEIALLVNFTPGCAFAATAFGFSMILYETTQEVLRATQRASAVMRGTVIRAVLVSALGVACALLAKSGPALLTSSSVAFVIATASIWRRAWGGTLPRFNPERIWLLAKVGVPLTVSVSLAGLAGVTDRFMLAALDGPAAAGQFGGSFDLVRQGLLMPAMSVAAAFFPMTVEIFATRGVAATREHLDKCLELLLAVILPACIGLAVVSAPIADVVLGPDLRASAYQAMPALCVSIIFQTLTQQYLHISFLLSKRNVFYLINTGSILVLNLLLAYPLIARYGVMGAVWARLATDVFGFVNAYVLTRYAFPVPFSLGRVAPVVVSVAAMAFVVRATMDAAASLGVLALPVEILAGVVVYVAMAFALNIADARSAALRILRERFWRSGDCASQNPWRTLWRSPKA